MSEERVTDRRQSLIGLGVATAALALGAGRAKADDTAPAGSIERIRSSGELKLGVAQGEPWFFKDQRSGEWHGIGWGVGVALAKFLGVKPVPVETTWGNSVAGLETGHFDVMFVLDATPERALAVDFPVQPMFYYASAVLARDGVAAKTWSDLDKSGNRIGVILGTAADLDLSSRFKSAQISRFPSGDEAGAGLMAGRVDALAMYAPALVLLKNRLKSGSVVVPTPARQSPTSAGVRREADKDWRDWVGVGIGYLYQTGQTEQIYEDYLKFRGIDPASAPGLMPETWSRSG